MMICNKVACTGCGLCKIICPVNAIDMRADRSGFLYPIVEKSRCIECGRCVKECPIHKNENKKVKVELYAAWNKDRKERLRSTSGGVFILLARQIIKKNGIVIGAMWDENFHVTHRAATTLEELEKISGSKYVQSEICAWPDIREKLDEGRMVLFSGTPCQVHALRNYLNKDYSNLYCVDVVCHGVPSYKIFERYLQAM